MGYFAAREAQTSLSCPACGKTVYVSEDDLDAGEAICPSCKVAFEVALADDEEAEEDDEDDFDPNDLPEGITFRS